MGDASVPLVTATASSWARDRTSRHRFFPPSTLAGGSGGGKLLGPTLRTIHSGVMGRMYRSPGPSRQAVPVRDGSPLLDGPDPLLGVQPEVPVRVLRLSEVERGRDGLRR